MPAHLLIRDGSPYWWESPDIWVVPGADPNGAPGAPVAGQPAYLWARVQNTGNAAAPATRVDFYWANPAGLIAVGTATPIGSAFVDLDPGQSQEVLCLVAWIPTIVNGGHECLLAVAHGDNDTNPIPDPLPSAYSFDPPQHDQVAQHNLGVVPATMAGMPLIISVNGLARAERQARLIVEFGAALPEPVLAKLGLKGLRPSQHRVVEATLGRTPHCGDKPDPGAGREIDIEVARGTAVPVYLELQADKLPKGEYQLIHVVEHSAGRIVGGVSYVVVNANEESAS